MKKIYSILLFLCLNIFAHAQTTTYSYTGSLQNYTVGAGVSSVTITAKGAQGGNSTYSGNNGGLGAIIAGTFTVTPGHVLDVMVGQQPAATYYAAGGGGGSFVWDVTAGDVLMIAAGGGGGGSYSSTGIGGDASTTTSGTAGESGLYGGAGTAGSGGVAATSVYYAAGGAGWLSNGCNSNYIYCGTTATGGSTPLTGGAGGTWGGTSGYDGPGGYGGGGGGQGRCGCISSGGGGGYSGGGPGIESAYSGAYYGSGGGGSYFGGTGETSSVANTGNGEVVITVANCTGTPSTGTIGASDTSGCGSYSSMLSLAGASSSSGITYQWQSSPDGSTWTNVTGATTVPYTVTVTSTIYYRCVVTCTLSGGTSATSASIELFYHVIPATIAGSTPMCPGSTITLTDATSGGTWSSTSVSVATVGSSTGIATGVTTAGGTTTITYTTGFGCYATTTVTVNSSPPLITGILSVCTGFTTTLSDISTGGTWTSTTSTVGTISSTGVVSGVVAGTTLITYSLGSTCNTTVTVTVHTSPAAVTGPGSVCTGHTITLADSAFGALWSSPTVTTATVGSTSGIVTGVAAGITNITFTAPGGCIAIKQVTVNGTPAAITGTAIVCTGNTTTLADIMTGGGWSSTVATVATIDGVTGIVSALTPGNTTISYTTVAGCYATDIVTVDLQPVPISGNNSVCQGYTITLTDGTAGGAFTSSTSSIASVGSVNGVVSGVSTGIANITYTLAYCTASVPITVNPVLAVSTAIAASGGDTICQGRPNTYLATSVNAGTSPVYSWTVSGAPVSGVTGNSYTYSPANGDIVKCVLTSNATCAIPNTASSNSIYMTVNSLSIPTVTMYPTSQDTLCVGTVQTYSITTTNSGTHPTYQWSINWIPVATGVTSYTYTPNNGDIIRCGMASSSRCPVPDTAFAIDTMVVNTYDTPRVAIVGLAGLSACQGNMITLNANSSWGGMGPKYYWSVNGIPAGVGGTQYIYKPVDGDMVSCMMISDYNCPRPSDTAKSTVTMKVDPILTVQITDSHGGLISGGTIDTMMAIVQNGGSAPAYQWYKNGIMIPGANSFRLIDHEISNKDSISCMVTTGSGSACEGIRGDNWVIMEVAPAGITTIGTGISDIRLMPNPNTGTFTVEGTIKGVDKDITLEIADVIGQEVYRETIPVNGVHLLHKVTMDNGFANGVYILHLISENGNNVVRFTVNK